MELTLFKKEQAYFFRTNHYDYVGTVTDRYDGFLMLKDSATIKNTGRLEYTLNPIEI